MKSLKSIVFISVVLMILAGCSSTGKEEDMAGEGMAGDAGQAASTQGVDGGGDYMVHPLDDKSSPLATRVIYFAFDSSAVEPQYEAVVAAHAAYLAANPDTSIVLEGHADERGTREYNIALGERRAKAIQDLLVLQGASSAQQELVSYGEEKPVALGHDEASWHLNRRVEILYPAY